MLLNPSLSNPPSSKNPKSGPQRIRLDITWDKNKDQRNSLWVVFWSLSACYPGVPVLCQTPSSRIWHLLPPLEACPAGPSSNSHSPHHSHPQTIPILAHKSGFALCSEASFFFSVPHLHATIRKQNLQWLNDLVTQLPIPRGSTHSGELTDISAWLHSPGCAVRLLCSHFVFNARQRSKPGTEPITWCAPRNCSLAQIKLWLLWERAWNWEGQLATPRNQKWLLFTKEEWCECIPGWAVFVWATFVVGANTYLWI